MNYQGIYHFMKTGESLSEKTEKELKLITQQYPWFETGHILSAIYKQKFGAEDTNQQLQKARIYMHNPLWLNWQIMKFNQGIPQNTIEIKEAIQETIVEEIFVNNNTPPSTEKNEQEGQKDNLFIFEPLHTIDYFASQGIKLQQEQLGNDNFSQQVKTFTQWLKSMKKIYQDAPSLIPQKDEGGVVLMADASNKNEEIYTETMAEVLINQGKKTQAIAIYEKLSLLYPEKSSYFTARISELNK